MAWGAQEASREDPVRQLALARQRENELAQEILRLHTADGAFNGEERLLEILSTHRQSGARQIEDAILGAVGQFVGNRARSDDITLAIVTRIP